MEGRHKRQVLKGGTGRDVQKGKKFGPECLNEQRGGGNLQGEMEGGGLNGK